mmetsp:Transcript_33031/g.76415  ORF Transcript_33031/g.76415 Transcript_33031/m.76415 type:complete len:232 (-) Transcript_33031:740-1435(-)
MWKFTAPIVSTSSNSRPELREFLRPWHVPRPSPLSRTILATASSSRHTTAIRSASRSPTRSHGTSRSLFTTVVALTDCWRTAPWRSTLCLSQKVPTAGSSRTITPYQTRRTARPTQAALHSISQSAWTASVGTRTSQTSRMCLVTPSSQAFRTWVCAPARLANSASMGPRAICAPIGALLFPVLARCTARLSSSSSTSQKRTLPVRQCRKPSNSRRPPQKRETLRPRSRRK